MQARATAARILARVLQKGTTLDNAYAALIPPATGHQDQAYIKELCYGVLRWFFRLNFILDQLTDKTIRRKDTDIRAVILCGMYQLDFLRTPSHAAVSASVDAVSQLNKDWAKQLVNAILRRYQREAAELGRLVQTSESAIYAHPQWLISRFRSDWPEHWTDILEANNQRAPMFLRVNLQKTRREEYLQKLADNGITAMAVAETDCGIRLQAPVDIDMLPGFAQGMVSVQDIGAQHAAILLDLQAGQRVLDACAAPGGKTGHIHEAEPALAGLTAIEKDKTRLVRLIETSQRLGMEAEILQADAALPDSWWNGIPFDRILLDVPCSATGVIRRHPDIKVLRQEDAIGKYCDLQGKLLESVWSMLNSQGRLVYATCSILSAENDQQIKIFLKKFPDAKIMDIMTNWGVKTEFGIQTLPGIGNVDADGFYYAVLVKP